MSKLHIVAAVGALLSTAALSGCNTTVVKDVGSLALPVLGVTEASCEKAIGTSAVNAAECSVILAVQEGYNRSNQLGNGAGVETTYANTDDFYKTLSATLRRSSGSYPVYVTAVSGFKFDDVPAGKASLPKLVALSGWTSRIKGSGGLIEHKDNTMSAGAIVVWLLEMAWKAAQPKISQYISDSIVYAPASRFNVCFRTNPEAAANGGMVTEIDFIPREKGSPCSQPAFRKP